MSYFQPTRFDVMPPVIKNLIIINVLWYIAVLVFDDSTATYIGRMYQWFGMYPFGSDGFKPYQMVTHMFMHGGIGHIFFNMFALWMFGAPLENTWGPKRFLTFYLVTALGAALLHQGVNAFEIYQLKQLAAEGNIQASIDIAAKMAIPTVGASGAVFGVLLGFGMLYPNQQILIYFLFPIKAKYFVIIYGAIELFMGIQNNPADNVAHFAHLGGMLFGFILIKIWQRDRRHFY